MILDGTDNFQTRYLINDLAVKHGVPYVYAGAVATGGMQMTVLPGRGPCLRCVFPEPPPPGAAATCDTAGILGPVISIVAGAQAVEGLKVLLGQEERVSRTLLEFDVWSNQRRRLDISGAGPRGDCPCCGRRDFAYLAGAGGGATALCGRHAVQVGGDGADGMDLDALARRLAPHGRFTANEYLLRGVLERERGDSGEPIELTVFPDGRTIVRGTDRVEVARSIHARYVGS